MNQDAPYRLNVQLSAQTIKALRHGYEGVEISNAIRADYLGQPYSITLSLLRLQKYMLLVFF
jgi:hypothetical protein